MTRDPPPARVLTIPANRPIPTRIKIINDFFKYKIGSIIKSKFIRI